MPGPLDGYTILDLTQVVSGPLAAMLFADQGADVIKVEPLGTGGDLTRLPAFAKGGLPAFYLNNNRGKRSIAVDVGTDEGKAVLFELAGQVDIIMQNFRPGAVERMGIGYEQVKAVNPTVIYCSISGFGPDGPYSDRPVLDPVIQGLTGMVSRQFNPQIPFPDLVRNLIADKSTALTVSQAVTAALLVREKQGVGQHVEVPMLDAAMYFFWPDGMMDKTVLDEDASPGFLLASVYSLSEASDGKFVYFAASDPQRLALYRAVGHPEWCEDERYNTMAAMANPENFEAVGAMLAEAFLTMTVEEILTRLVEEDVPCGPILDADQAIADAQMIHNGTLHTWQHPLAGTVQQPVPAARFSETPAAVAESASLKGADTDEILAQFGKSAEEIAALRDAGAVG
ncbi:MAG: CaiB/BaiF CoA-transferase family protein [Actinomycetota bacterium]